MEAIRAAWGDRAEQILAANNQHPPMVLRVDPAQIHAEDFLRSWRAVGRDASVSNGTPMPWSGARGASPVVAGLRYGCGVGPGRRRATRRAAARCGARDASARCLRRAGARHAHRATHPGFASLLAADDDSLRLCVCARICSAPGWTPFAHGGSHRAATLAGAGLLRSRTGGCACSATGVIRRHPDIKLLRRPSDLESFAATQRRILATAFELLKPGGRLVYCTCSLMPAENEGVLGDFLAAQSRARVLDWPEALPRPPELLARQTGWQLLPGGGAGTDGFYYACLSKTHPSS